MQQDGLFAFPMQDQGNVCVSIKPDICGASWDAAISAQTATFSSLGVKEQKKVLSMNQPGVSNLGPAGSVWSVPPGLPAAESQEPKEREEKGPIQCPWRAESQGSPTQHLGAFWGVHFPAAAHRPPASISTFN